MKTKWIATAAAVALMGINVTVQAVPITGSIGFTGNYVQVGGSSSDLGTATSMNITTVFISAPATTGDLSGATLNSFATPIGVNGNAPSLIGNQLWSVDVGLTTYTFQVTTLVETLGADHTTLTLAGKGILSNGTPADDTAGTWTLGFGASGAAFTWNSTSANAVPDGGTTVMLLGGTLTGLGLLRKKLIA